MRARFVVVVFLLSLYFTTNYKDAIKEEEKRRNGENDFSIFFPQNKYVTLGCVLRTFENDRIKQEKTYTQQIYDYCSLLIAYYQVFNAFKIHLFHVFMCPIYFCFFFFSLSSFFLQLTLGICLMRRRVCLLSYNSN